MVDGEVEGEKEAHIRLRSTGHNGDSFIIHRRAEEGTR